jgi:AraC-like DNA-binding protein
MRTILSTADVSPLTAFKTWQEAVVERIVPVELTPLDHRPFKGTLEAADVGPLIITRVTQSAMRTVATPDTIRRHNKHDTLTVGFVLNGEVTSLQGDRQAVQRAGEIVVLDRIPTVMATRADSSSLILEIPRDRLQGMLGSVKLFSCMTIGANQASTSIAAAFFNEYVRVQSRLAPDAAARMASIGIDLIVAGIAEHMASDVPKHVHGNLVVQRAKAYIESNLHNQTLDPPHLAAAVGVSLRRLQELFHERGRSVSDWIWGRRLEIAALRLADPSFGHMALGMLAYGCGFSSQAHFSRRFRDRFGMTPSEYRHAAKLAAGQTL